MFANPPLAEAAFYVCILVSLMALWTRVTRRGVTNLLRTQARLEVTY
jgi:hypothetical protein